MIILDTNVISELMRPNVAAPVLRWAESQPAARFFTTAITKAEIYYGIRILAQGQRRKALEAAADKILSMNLMGRVLPFDSAAADHYASIASMRRSKGHAIGEPDCQIAAIALVHNAALATHNTADFENSGIRLIDPWKTK